MPYGRYARTDLGPGIEIRYWHDGMSDTFDVIRDGHVIGICDPTRDRTGDYRGIPGGDGATAQRFRDANDAARYVIDNGPEIIIGTRCAATNDDGSRRCPFPAAPNVTVCPVHMNGAEWAGMRA